MKVLLIEPKAYGEYPGAMQPHLGLAYLASVLLQRQIDVEIVDMRLGYTFKDLLSKIRFFNPDLVGVTVYSIQFGTTRRLVNMIKESTDRMVVIGGPHISACRSEVMRTMKADFAVKGEGEYTLPDLCNFLESGKSKFNEIEGLIWRDRDKIVENVDRPYINNLDALSFPAFEKFELKRYIFYKERRLPIVTSRGCPYRCIFCSVRLSMGQKLRPRSPENLVGELEYWYSKGWRQFDFEDDCFSFDLNRAKKICDLIIERGLKIKWFLFNGIRVDRIDRELLSKMKKARCEYVQYGIESGSNEVLRAIRKGITIEKAVKAIKMTREIGISQSVNFIIGHPTETFETAMETLNFARSIAHAGVLVNVYNLIPYPGTELYQFVERHGTFLQPEEVFLDGISYKSEKPVFETREFPSRERERAIKIGLSIARKSWLQGKMGYFVGSLLWVITESRVLDRMFLKLALGTRFGRRLYNLLKRV